MKFCRLQAKPDLTSHLFYAQDNRCFAGGGNDDGDFIQ
jgi:hypothetical protein